MLRNVSPDSSVSADEIWPKDQPFASIAVVKCLTDLRHSVRKVYETNEFTTSTPCTNTKFAVQVTPIDGDVWLRNVEQICQNLKSGMNQKRHSQEQKSGIEATNIHRDRFKHLDRVAIGTPPHASQMKVATVTPETLENTTPKKNPNRVAARPVSVPTIRFQDHLDQEFSIGDSDESAKAYVIPAQQQEGQSLPGNAAVESETNTLQLAFQLSQERCSALERELEGEKSLTANYKQDLDRLTEATKRLQSQILLLTSENGALSETVALLRLSITRLESTAEHHITERTLACVREAELVRQLTLSQEGNKDLEVKVESLSAVKLESINAMLDLQLKFEEMSAELRREQSEGVTSIQMKEDIIASLKQQLVDISERCEVARAAEKRVMAASSDRVKDMQSIIDTLKFQVEGLKESVLSQQRTIESLTSSQALMSESTAALESQKSELLQTLQNLTVDSEKYNAHLHTMESKIIAKDGELRESGSRLYELTVSYELSNEHLKIASDQRTELEQQLKVALDQRVDLEREIEESRREATAVLRSVKKLEKKMVKLVHERSTLSDAWTTERELRLSIEQEYVTLQHTLGASVQASSARLSILEHETSGEITVAQDIMNSLRLEKGRLLQQLDMAHMEAEDKASQIVALRHEMNAFAWQTKNHEAEVACWKGEIEALLKESGARLTALRNRDRVHRRAASEYQHLLSVEREATRQAVVNLVRLNAHFDHLLDGKLNLATEKLWSNATTSQHEGRRAHTVDSSALQAPFPCATAARTILNEMANIAAAMSSIDALASISSLTGSEENSISSPTRRSGELVLRVIGGDATSDFENSGVVDGDCSDEAEEVVPSGGTALVASTASHAAVSSPTNSFLQTLNIVGLQESEAAVQLEQQLQRLDSRLHQISQYWTDINTHLISLRGLVEASVRSCHILRDKSSDLERRLGESIKEHETLIEERDSYLVRLERAEAASVDVDTKYRESIQRMEANLESIIKSNANHTIEVRELAAQLVRSQALVEELTHERDTLTQNIITANQELMRLRLLSDNASAAATTAQMLLENSQLKEIELVDELESFVATMSALNKLSIEDNDLSKSQVSTRQHGGHKSLSGALRALRETVAVRDKAARKLRLDVVAFSDHIERYLIDQTPLNIDRRAELDDSPELGDIDVYSTTRESASELQRLQAAFAGLKSHVDNLTSQLNAESAQQEYLSAVLQERNVLISQQIAIAEASTHKLQAADTAAIDLQCLLATAKEHTKLLEKRAVNNSAAMNELEQQLSRMEKEKNAVEVQYETLVSTLETERQEHATVVASLEAEQRELMRELERRSSAELELRKRILIWETDNSILTERISTLDNEFQSLQQSLKDTVTMQTSLKGQYHAEVCQYHAELGQIRSEAALLQSQLEESTSAMSLADTRYLALEAAHADTVEGLRRELGATKAAHAGTVEGLERELGATKAALLSAQSAIESFESSTSSTCARVEELEASNRALDEESKDLMNRWLDIRERLQRMKQSHDTEVGDLQRQLTTAVNLRRDALETLDTASGRLSEAAKEINALELKLCSASARVVELEGRSTRLECDLQAAAASLVKSEKSAREKEIDMEREKQEHTQALQACIETHSSALSSLQLQRLEIDDSRAALTLQLSAALNRYAQLHSSHVDTQERHKVAMGECQDRIDLLESSVQSLTTERDVAMERAAVSCGECERLQLELGQLQDCSVVQTEELKVVQVLFVSRNERLADLELQASGLSDEVRNLTLENLRLTTEVESGADRLRRMTEQHESTAVQYGDSVAQLSIRIDAMESERQSLEAAADSANDHLSRALREKTDAEAVRDALAETLRASQAQVVSYSAVISATTESLADTESSRAAALEQVSYLTTLIERMEDEHRLRAEEARKKLNTLEAAHLVALEQAREDGLSAQKQHAALVGEYSELLDRIAQERVDNVESLAQLRSVELGLKSAVEEGEARVSSIERENAVLMQELSSLQLDNREKIANIQRCEEANSALCDDVRALTVRAEADGRIAEASRSDLQSELATCRTDLLLAHSQILSLEERVAAAVDQCATTKRQQEDVIADLSQQLRTTDSLHKQTELALATATEELTVAAHTLAVKAAAEKDNLNRLEEERAVSASYLAAIAVTQHQLEEERCLTKLLQGRIEALEHELVAHETSHSHALQALDSYKNELQQWHARYSAADDSLSSLSSKLATAIADHKETNSRWHEELVDLEQCRLAVEEERDSLLDCLHSAHAELAEAKDGAMHSAAVTAALRRKVDGANAQCTELLAVIARLKETHQTESDFALDRCRDLQLRIEDLQQRDENVQAMRAHIEGSSREVEELQQERVGLQCDLQRMLAAAVESETHLESIKDQLGSELEEANRRLREAHETAETMTAVLTTTSDKLHTVEDRNRELLLQLEALHSLKAAADAALEDSQRELENVIAERNGGISELNTLQTRINHIEEERGCSVEDFIRSQIGQVEVLEQECKELLQSRRELEQQLEDAVATTAALSAASAERALLQQKTPTHMEQLQAASYRADTAEGESAKLRELLQASDAELAGRQALFDQEKSLWAEQRRTYQEEILRGAQTTAEITATLTESDNRHQSKLRQLQRDYDDVSQQLSRAQQSLADLKDHFSATVLTLSGKLVQSEVAACALEVRVSDAIHSVGEAESAVGQAERASLGLYSAVQEQWKLAMKKQRGREAVGKEQGSSEKLLSGKSRKAKIGRSGSNDGSKESGGSDLLAAAGSGSKFLVESAAVTEVVKGKRKATQVATVRSEDTQAGVDVQLLVDTNTALRTEIGKLESQLSAAMQQIRIQESNANTFDDIRTVDNASSGDDDSASAKESHIHTLQLQLRESQEFVSMINAAWLTEKNTVAALQTSQDSVRRENNALQAQLCLLQQQLETLACEKDRIQAQAMEAVAEIQRLQSQVLQSAAELSHLRTEAGRLDSASSSSTASLRSELQEALSELSMYSESARRLQDENLALTVKIRSLGESHTEALAALERQLRGVREELKRTAERATAAHEQLEQCELQHAHKVLQVQQEHKEQLAILQQSWRCDTEASILREKDHAVAAVHAGYEETLKTLKLELQKARELSSDRDEILIAANKRAQEEVDALNSLWKQKLENKVAEYQQTIADLKASHNLALTSRTQESTSELLALEVKHTIALQQCEASHSEAHAVKAREYETLLEAREVEYGAALEARLAEASVSAAQEMTRLESEFTQTVTELQQQHDAILERQVVVAAALREECGRLLRSRQAIDSEQKATIQAQQLKLQSSELKLQSSELKLQSSESLLHRLIAALHNSIKAMSTVENNSDSTRELGSQWSQDDDGHGSDRIVEALIQDFQHAVARYREECHSRVAKSVVDFQGDVAILQREHQALKKRHYGEVDAIKADLHTYSMMFARFEGLVETLASSELQLRSQVNHSELERLQLQKQVGLLLDEGRRREEDLHRYMLDAMTSHQRLQQLEDAQQEKRAKARHVREIAAESGGFWQSHDFQVNEMHAGSRTLRIQLDEPRLDSDSASRLDDWDTGLKQQRDALYSVVQGVWQQLAAATGAHPDIFLDISFSVSVPSSSSSTSSSSSSTSSSSPSSSTSRSRSVVHITTASGGLCKGYDAAAQSRPEIRRGGASLIFPSLDRISSVLGGVLKDRRRQRRLSRHLQLSLMATRLLLRHYQQTENVAGLT